MDLTSEDAADENVVAAYSMATYKDGTKSYEVMRRFEIDRVRECSQTGATKDRRGQPRKSSGPWVDFFSEMAKKTVMRRHSKTLPMSGDLLVDVEDREHDVSAHSAERILAVEPDAPIRLPTNDELDAQDEGMDVRATDRLIKAFDDAKDPGDLLEPREDYLNYVEQRLFERGQAEDIENAFERACKRLNVDPETGELAKDSATGFTEVDEETARRLDAGEPEDEGEPETDAADETEVSPLEAKLAELRDGLAKAKTLEEVRKVDMEWVKHRAACDDGTQAQVDQAIAARRRALNA